MQEQSMPVRGRYRASRGLPFHKKFCTFRPSFPTPTSHLTQTRGAMSVKRSALRIAAALALSVVLLSAQDPSAQQVELTLLSTTDLHCALLSYDYYKGRPDDSFGLDRTASIIKQMRAEYQNTLLFDCGDHLQGNPLSDFKAWVDPVEPGESHPMYAVMNRLKYDAAAVGNHEFNYGLDFLMQVTQKADFPLVLANVYDADSLQPLFQPYVLLDREPGGVPIRIGVIGFAPPQILQWDRTHLEGKVLAEDIVKSAKRYLPWMAAAGADVIVALAHSGLNHGPYVAGMENAVYHLSRLQGIDAILFGHSHSRFPGDDRFDNLEEKGVDNLNGRLHGIPAVMPGFWGNHLGVVHLQLEHDGHGWTVQGGTGEILPIKKKDADGNLTVESADPEIEKIVHEDHLGAIEYINTPIGTSTIALETYFALVRDCNAIQLINNAQTDYVRNALAGTLHAGLPVLSAAAPFKTDFRGTGYTDIQPGGITIRNVADLYVYPNLLHAVKIDGNTLKGWLERSAEVFNQIKPDSAGDQMLINPKFSAYNFDIIDGITYEIDVSAKPGNRIRNLQYQGKAATGDSFFIVVTNNYRASGGGEFPGLDGSNIVLAAPDANRDIVIRYIQKKGTIGSKDVADGNWKFSPLTTKGRVLYRSANGVEDLAAKLKGLHPAEDADAGGRWYDVRFEK